MISARGYAAPAAGQPLGPFQFDRRDPGSEDVVIEILYCGICHSDIHSVRDEWGRGNYPMVPGHEIVGRVSRTGAGVTRFKPGNLVGVGCFVDSCRGCSACKSGQENYCEKGALFTYNSHDKEGNATRGGYSSHIVVDENYVLRIPDGLSPNRAAPLLCAGITTYSPLKHWKVGRGHSLGVVGLGGLGHMAVKFGASLGAKVTVFSSSAHKREESSHLGAHNFVLTKEKKTMDGLLNSFDFIIDTVSATHDVDSLLALLRREGTLILVGAPGDPLSLSTFSLIMGRRTMAGSLIGGIKETQEMLDYCAKRDVQADVEVIPVSRVNEAYERVLRGDVRYRFVLDMKTL
ncbi:MAG: NAD(P)-dependent alcohol dehydrogenase [Elusimicrobia bacterium]|nr:NAD(P)-dependent alcohol dehydrogenase [Elusimicrobiota bacterium]